MRVLPVALALVLSASGICRAEGPQIGAGDFLPTAEEPTGFRGGGTGCWPGVEHPTFHWHEGLADGPDTGILWRVPLRKSMSQPIVVGKKVFTVEEPHILTCIDADTGQVLWRRENDHLELFSPEKQKRAQALLKEVQKNVYDRIALAWEYHWKRGDGLSEGLGRKAKAGEPRLESDDPRTPARLKEIENLWIENNWSRRKNKDGSYVNESPVDPENFGHGKVVFDKGTPEFEKFYGGVLRELLVEYGIAALVDHTGLVMANSGNTQITPVSDGKHVYANFGYGQTVCYDMEGNRQWMVWHPHNLGDIAESYGSSGGWADHIGNLIGLFGNSPILVDGYLITSQGMAIRALDKETGKLVWEYRFDRSHGGNRSYGTPAPMTFESGRKVLIAAHGAVIDFETGKELTGITEPFDFFNVPYGNVHCTIVGSPVVDGQKVYFSWGMGAVAYQVNEHPDGTVSFDQLWLATVYPKRSAEDTSLEKEDARLRAKRPNSLSPETWHLCSPVLDVAHKRLHLVPALARKIYMVDMETGENLGYIEIPKPGDTRNTACGIRNGRSAPALVGGRYLYAQQGSGCCLILDTEDLSVKGHNHIVIQFMRDVHSDADFTPGWPGYGKGFYYPRDPAHRRVPWEIMKSRWFDRGFNAFNGHSWPTDQNALPVWRSPVFQGSRIYLRAFDALYCFEEGATDEAPPSVPSGLNAKLVQRGDRKVIELRWQESTDNVRLFAYRVLVNGTEERRVGYPLAEFPAELGKTYTFSVIAEDGSGNRSEASEELKVKVDSRDIMRVSPETD